MSLKMNESNIDRIIRVVIGLLAFAAALSGMVTGMWAIVAYILTLELSFSGYGK